MKQELSKFWKRLKNHPGVSVAIALQLMGSFAGLTSRQDNVGLRALVGFGIMSIFWIPVLLTSWIDRNKET